MLQYTQLFRPLNLAFMALMMLLLRYFLIAPLYQLAGISFSLSDFQFLLLIISVVSIAAGGYLINDYFDQRTDQINKPEKAVIGQSISASKAIQIYGILTGFGVLLGTYLAFQVGSFRLVSVHILSAALLWFYSASLQRKPLVGNLAVSLLLSISVFTVVFFDAALVVALKAQIKTWFLGFVSMLANTEIPNNIWENIDNQDVKQFILQYVGAYALFAFLLNLVREIVKDIEDIDGDRRANYNTFPIWAGTPFAKLFATAFVLLSFKLLFDFQLSQYQLDDKITPILVLVFLQIPLLYLAFRLFRATFKEDFKHISSVLKIVMFFGLLYLPYFSSTIAVEENLLGNIELPEGVSIDDVQFINFDTPIDEADNIADTNAIFDPVDTMTTIIDENIELNRENGNINIQLNPE